MRMECIRLCIRETRAVDPYGRGGHHPFEIYEDALALGGGRKFEAPPIERDKLVSLLIEAVPRQSNVGVRDDDLIKPGVVEILIVPSFNDSAAVAPFAVDGQN